ncbi:hypothetical protein [Dietzia maris]|uniref:hypothetical protein n=1 Tax=Dietzia maris TaxID=37915 RepID=UPI0037C5FCCE
MTNVYRVHSPSRRRTVLATTRRHHAQGRAHALNQSAVTDGGLADWTVQHAYPTWGPTNEEAIS